MTLLIVMASADELLASIISDNNNEITKNQEDTPETVQSITEPIVSNGNLTEENTKDLFTLNDLVDVPVDIVDAPFYTDGNEEKFKPSTENLLEFNDEVDSVQKLEPKQLDEQVLIQETDEETMPVEKATTPTSAPETPVVTPTTPVPMLASNPDSPNDDEKVNNGLNEHQDSECVSPIEIVESIISDTDTDVVDSALVLSTSVVAPAGEVTLNDHSNEDSGHITDENSFQLNDSSTPCDAICKLCDNKFVSPRVLTCLHVFCEGCIQKIMVDEAGDLIKKIYTVSCPLCKQVTKVNCYLVVIL